MFAKPLRVKGNTSLKNSEKKNLLQRIQSHFPRLTDEDAKILLPNKSTSTCMKIVTHSDITISVYTVDNVPIVIEAWDKMFPTIYAQWKCPDIMPTITIHRTIVKKLQNGAPLFLPGVLVPPQGIGFPEFSIGQVIGINTEDNAAIVMVGAALMSSGDMLLKAGGSCLETIQILGDFLCKEVKTKVERPQLEHSLKLRINYNENLAETLQKVSLSSSQSIKEDWPSLGPKPPKQRISESNSLQENNRANTPVRPESPAVVSKEPEEPEETVSDDDEDEENDGVPRDMDGLLKYCLLSFLKAEGKRIEFPLKTNLLYRNHMVPICPAGHNLDLKKSSYKKMGKFIDAMQKDGILLCKEIDKGVDALVGVDLSHPDIKRHVILGVPTIQDEVIRESEMAAPLFIAPEIKEMYSVTASVLSLFAPLKKGTTLTGQEVRSHLTNYVKTHNLQQKSLVNPDAVLTTILGSNVPVNWEQIMNAVMNKMSFCNELVFPDGTVKVIKGKLDPIQMQVATRSGNKKVTLVSNLESYGIDLATLSKECQHGVAASCTITRTAGAKNDQLLVQGNQTYFLLKHLMDNYNIPKKYIEGADKALKKKK